MLPLLQNPAFQKRAMPLSIEAWHQMVAKGLAPKRAELIRGVIVEKMSKSILHTKLAGRLLAVFLNSCAGYWVRKEEPITLKDSEPEPDVSIVEGSETDYENHPTKARLVVEVAVTTLSEDREMADLYAEGGIEEYWIVNAPERAIEVFRQPVGGHYSVVSRISSGTVSTCGLDVDVAALFAGLPSVE